MIKVLHPGFYTTVQDLGRKEYQHLGVPVSGVMDLYAGKMANMVLGNDDNCSVLEITMIGPKLEFTVETNISITGAYLSPSLNGNLLQNNTIINICKGDVITFGKPKYGFRSYLAVNDGFKTQDVLNSKSMYRGITNDFCIKNGETLEINTKSHSTNKNALAKFDTNYLYNNIIEVYEGPELHQLTNVQVNLLFNSEFTISKDNSRMAYQLEELVDNDLKDIITSLVLPGTVQLTPSGKLIVLMRDCQTTGGYPRVLQLSEASINILAQKFTGAKIKFKLIN